MPYCSVEEAWGKNFQKSVKPPKRVTPPRPKICDYKIEEGVVGAPDTGAYASFKTGGGGAASRERFSTRMEPLEYQRGEGLNNVETNIDVGGPITDSFIENLYYSKQKTNEEPSPYSLLNSANANVVMSNNHLQDQYRKYVEYIEKLERRIKKLERDLEKERSRTKNSGIYNIIIYIVTGIFIIFLLDCFVRLGKCMGNGGFGGSLALKQPELKEFVPDLRQYLPQRRQFVPNRFYYN